MAYAVTSDEVKLYYEEVGHGTPILFVHEFAGDHRSWEKQLRAFGKRYRCIAYAARGYKPSDVPSDPAAYSYLHVMRDAVAVLDHLQIEQRAPHWAVDGRLHRVAGCAQSSRAAFGPWFLPARVQAASAGIRRTFTSAPATSPRNSRGKARRL